MKQKGVVVQSVEGGSRSTSRGEIWKEQDLQTSVDLSIVTFHNPHEKFQFQSELVSVSIITPNKLQGTETSVEYNQC